MTKKHFFRGRASLPRAVCAVLLLVALLCAPAYAAETSLVPVGRTVGIQLQMPGAMVVGLSTADCPSPAQAAGIRTGDLIVAIQGKSVSSASAFLEQAAKIDGTPVCITVERSGSRLDFTVTPSRTESGWVLGLWLRDSITGIGTLTYYDPETGFYGALGHPINDVDTGVRLPVGSGKLMDAEITGVRPGQVGRPGELSGSFDFDHSCGSILINSDCGIFGYLDGIDPADALPVATASEIHPGKASILSNVEGCAVAEYEIEIEQVQPGGAHPLSFRVTDQKLLSITGGIVQGMSGSPILQDGKLVGAVTHVLINDPTRGYGIFIENMLDAAA
ncbi:MAG: SpoIVB peptidase [Oscillospiraceae bacterium]|nr:SpoIVB peptidase [Oscillospiraceae bacterium]